MVVVLVEQIDAARLAAVRLEDGETVVSEQVAAGGEGKQAVLHALECRPIRAAGRNDGLHVVETRAHRGAVFGAQTRRFSGRRHDSVPSFPVVGAPAV